MEEENNETIVDDNDESEIINEEEEAPEENETIMSRVIPMLPPSNEYEVVRCVCGSRNPMGKLIKCVRCGCWSHKACVLPKEPYICTFCHQASRRILSDNYQKVPTQSGDLINQEILKKSIFSNLSVLEICELREHLDSLSQVQNLMKYLTQYFLQLDLNLEMLKKEISKPTYNSCREKLEAEIEKEKQLYDHQSKILLDLLSKLQDEQQKQTILPDLRNAFSDLLV